MKYNSTHTKILVSSGFWLKRQSRLCIQLLDSSLSFSRAFNSGASATLQANTMTKKQRIEAVVMLKLTTIWSMKLIVVWEKTIICMHEKAAKDSMCSLQRFRVKPVAQMQKFVDWWWNFYLSPLNTKLQYHGLKSHKLMFSIFCEEPINWPF